MSLVYSDTTNKDGIIQRIEQDVFGVDGYISGDATRLKFWTGSINLALDKVFHVIFSADGKWQFDDGNHTKNPFIFTELTINQRNYSFTADEQSNLILDIHSVYAKTSSTNPYYLLTPIDMQTDGNSGFNDGVTRLGWPTSYDKTGNNIKLDVTPEATVSEGLKIFINREGSYFATSDTTKVPGFAGLYHEYLVLEPAYRYARANNLSKQETFKRDVLELEKAIVKYYSRRSRDQRNVMTSKPIIFR
jgi:hypothetical protein